MSEVRTNSSSRVVSCAVLGYVLFAVALFAISLHTLFISGPTMRAAAREHLAQALADEDRSFCEQF